MAQDIDRTNRAGADDGSADPGPLLKNRGGAGAQGSRVRTGPRGRGVRVSVCAAALAASMACGLAPAIGSPTPPPNPSDSQLNKAQSAKTALATEVGTLGGMVVNAQNRLAALSGQVESAEQKLALAISQLHSAKAQAAQAQAAVAAAAKAVTAARVNLSLFVHDSYVQRSVTSGAGNLLSAEDPNALLQRGDYLRYVANRHLDAVAALNRATVAQSNADAKARAAVLLQQKYTDAAAQAQVAATQAYQAQQTQTVQLKASLVSYQSQLSDAQDQLATLNGQRAQYTAYVKEQQRLARIEAERKRRAAAAAKALAERLAAENLARLEAARLEAARAAAAAAAVNVNADPGSSGLAAQSVDAAPLPPPGSLGGWSAAAGQDAANRALRWVGTPYAWAAGGYGGPTYGVNSPGTDGFADSGVYGFDCSGLVMYAWAGEGLYLAHYAATQYGQAGSYHPSAGNFLPGDLLFWSSDGTVGGIHHVAIYIGGGNVVQAPNSGDQVRVTPWDQVSWGYFGATRPLS